MSVLYARDEKDVVAVIASGAGALEIVAGGTKRGLGKPMQTAATLDISGLAGIVDYEAPELVLTAKPGTPLREIKAALAAKGQMLACEPPDLRGLMGANAEPTLGGIIACNLSGPRRVKAGAPRDVILGFSAVNGRGEVWKAGGKVVKNVTGFDMMKLMTGSFGTLSVLTEVTLKVAPKPETEATLLLRGVADSAAPEVMGRALNTPHEVTAAAHLPEAAGRRSRIAGGAATLIRLEGPAPSVAYRAQEMLKAFGGELLDPAASTSVWEEIGEVQTLLPPGRLVWRLQATPSQGAAVVAEIARAFASAEAFYDWGGGLAWLTLDPAEAGGDGGAVKVRAAMRGGHATLVVAPEEMRKRVAVFEPLPGPLAALAQRVKASFDPFNILNPGRLG